MQVMRVPTGVPVGEIENLHLEVSWLAPEPGRSNTVLVCLPGGGMRREFFDMAGDFSFVAAMRQQGHGLLLIDHPGVGGSDQPLDGYLLTPRRIAELHHRALSTLRSRIPELADARSIGIGHSMGALLSLLQQAQHRSHAGLVLLGFGFDGLPHYLPEQARELLDDRAALEAASAELARGLFRVSYPLMNQGGSGGIYGGKTADSGAGEAISAVSTHLLPVPGFMSMYPQHWNADAALIDVPVLLALGDNDLVKAPDNAAEIFSASPDVQVMTLPETGHSQFVFSSRHALFAAINAWVDRH